MKKCKKTQTNKTTPLCYVATKSAVNCSVSLFFPLVTDPKYLREKAVNSQTYSGVVPEGEIAEGEIGKCLASSLSR